MNSQEQEVKMFVKFIAKEVTEILPPVKAEDIEGLGEEIEGILENELDTRIDKAIERAQDDWEVSAESVDGLEDFIKNYLENECLSYSTDDVIGLNEDLSNLKEASSKETVLKIVDEWYETVDSTEINKIPSLEEKLDSLQKKYEAVRNNQAKTQEINDVLICRIGQLEKEMDRIMRQKAIPGLTEIADVANKALIEAEVRRSIGRILSEALNIPFAHPV